MYLDFFIQYTIAFCTTLFLCVFLLRVPHILTNQSSLINQYYYGHFTTSIPLDYVLVLIYLAISMWIIKMAEIKRQLYKIGIVIGTTCCLTGGFCYYYRQRPMSTEFFSKLFHKAGYMTIVYDVILLVMTYTIIEYLKNNK